jgi:UDP-glucose 4-epimerase
MSFRNQRIVVTGGAGFVGSHVVDRLLAARNQVVVIDDLSTGSLANLAHQEDNPWLIVEQADVRDGAAMLRLLRGARFVCHLAARQGRLAARWPTAAHEVNAAGTLNVLQAAAAAGVERFLYCGGADRGTPDTLAMASRLAGAHYTQVFHQAGWLPTVVARLHGVYGPRSQEDGEGGFIPRFILRNLGGQSAFIPGDGSLGHDLTYVTEVAEQLVQLLECPAAAGQAFDVCRGEEVSLKAVARLVGELTGMKKPPVHQPGQPSEARAPAGDPGPVQCLLGPVSRMPLRDGLALTVEWFRQQADAAAVALEPVTEQDWHCPPPEAWLEAVQARQRQGRASA